MLQAGREVRWEGKTTGSECGGTGTTEGVDGQEAG